MEERSLRSSENSHTAIFKDLFQELSGVAVGS